MSAANSAGRPGRWGLVGAGVLALAALAALPAQAQVPDGMTPLLQSNAANGWHWSRTSHHGTTGKAEVKDGVLYLSQRPYGQGGLFLTDKRYKNFELYFETDVPWGVNSGVFLRSTEGGSAYQIELTQYDGGPPTAGSTAMLIGEALALPKPPTPPDLRGVWKPGWNAVRIRMTGDAPTVTEWVNGKLMWEVTEPLNTKIAGETAGAIGLQLHWNSTYQPELAKGFTVRFWRPGVKIGFRNIAIRELP